ncbi:gliding motility lipoprotein GldB [Pedobacter sp. SAFR-022]|uniref:gliding motility lipoprotein GldB n=1 Tax=Pedobacter sp. SAFR-022 TaxID=3436861 RepID=UPI003F7FBBD8
MNNTVKFSQIYLFFAALLILFSCKQNKRPDVEDIKLDISIARFDRDIVAGMAKGPAQTDADLAKKYGNFYQDYINRIVGNGAYSGPEILDVLYQDQAFKDLNHDADSVFKNMAPIEKDLTTAFKYIKHYYPEVNVPKFIAFVSGFEVQAPVGDGYMGIGLDMFLGKDSRFYPAIVRNVPMYLSRRFSPEYVVPRLAETFAREELFPERDEDRTLLSKMIHNGKILYFMDQVLDEKVPDSVKIGYTDQQLGWCSTYEGNIWGYFMEHELLFKTDYQKIQVYLSEGPFTPGLGEKNQSAPKLGVWMGWQIVRKYMKENPEVTLQALMAERDAEKILHASKYKPRQK